MKTKVVEFKVNSIEEFINALAKIGADIMGNTKYKESNEYYPIYIEALRAIAKKKGCTTTEAKNWLHEIHEVSPVAAFNIVAKELAIELDKKYKDHIENSDKIFVISTFDGRIHEVCKAHIKNYKNFAAFRTLEDAKTVCSVLKEPLKTMFRNVGKKEQED